MKKIIVFFLLAIAGHSPLQAQLAVAKMIGKGANNYKMGFGLFTYYDFPLNDIGNRSLRIELLDFAYFPSKPTSPEGSKAYLSIKLGYKYIFSSESQTGFYIEPQLGYCRVVFTDEDKDYGDGIAAALEAGYSLEVGQRGHAFHFGLKYETDRGAAGHTISSVGFRVSYSFNLFRRRSD